MADETSRVADSVNSQIVDAVNVTNERVLGDVPAQSHGVVLQTSACSISLLMLNAVTTQNASAQIASASVVAACAEIIKAAAAQSPPHKVE